LSGSVTFVLYPGNTCSGTALYTETSQAISGTSPQSAITHNISVKVSASAIVSWLVTYTPSNTSFISGNSHCEVTSLTITN
jgi:ADP-ribosylglycohydrolase